MKKTEIKCPVCGSTFELPEHETTVKNATVIGKDSGLGTIYLKVEKRKEALQKAGVDISKYFSVKSPSGEEKLMKWDNGTPVAVGKDDPVLKAIMEDTVPNRKLFRRWVMAQMFHALIYNKRTGRWGYRNRLEEGFTPWLRNHGYEYQWKMIVNELTAQAKMYKNGDFEAFRKRNRWFNKTVVFEAAMDFISETKKQIAKLPVKLCRGMQYKKVYGKNVFLTEMQSVIFKPLFDAAGAIDVAANPQALLAAVVKFNNVRHRTRISWDMPMSKAFIDAYKGAGAYYTLENLIRFHGATMQGMSKEKSLLRLEHLAEWYKDGEGWKLLGVMKETIERNGIVIEAKIASWRK